MKEKVLCYESTALKLLGLTKVKFDKLKIKPVKEVPNPHYKSMPPSRLYDRNKIEKLIDSPKVIALKPKPRKPVDYAAIFQKRYKSKESALMDASTSMFNLNRYCKHESCSARNRFEIYEIKNQFIEMLYHKGYCIECYIHYKILNEKICFSCDGTGISYNRKDQFSFGCDRCLGTGIYQEEGTLEFVVFHFLVDGEKFTWHQPKESVDFEFSITQEADNLNETQVKPMEINRSKLTEAKALIKWVMN